MILFTDDDLRALKERLRANKYSVSYRAVEGLIERLEAAEDCISVQAEGYEIWLKIAGKQKES